ncbi:MAG: tripartite tricarboxylate transporter substrate binding protein [Alphaproteobacteria bacterium]|nr:tripartite tricarboxylate transporter substrate binding protein [Alphaproteobacteria bacterium]
MQTETITIRLKRAAALLLAVSAALLAPHANAQSDYPSRPVRIIVPSSPGGGTDTVARLLGQHLSEKLGQQFVIENRPGGGSATGIEAGARATPDGYTLVMVASTMTSLHVTRKAMRFDAAKDFSPVTLIVSIPNVLVVHPSLPVKTFAELIELAKKEPGKLAFASPGLGSTTHMGMELLNSRAGIDLLHVPYNGVAPGLTDVLAGRVPVMLVNAVSVKQHLDAGTLRAIAVSSIKRASLLPDVPTIAESGIPGYDVYQWFGLLAPAETPKPIVSLLHREIVAGLNTPKIVNWMATEGGDSVGNKPEEFLKVIADDVERWSAVARAANLKAE